MIVYLFFIFVADDIAFLFSPSDTLGNTNTLQKGILYFLQITFLFLDIICIENQPGRRADAAKNVFTELNKHYLKLVNARKDAFLSVNRSKTVIIPETTVTNEKNEIVVAPGYSLANYTMTLTLLPHQVFIIPENYLLSLNTEQIKKNCEIIDNVTLRY